MSAFGYQYRNNVIRSDPVREPSPVVPLINRFAPLHGDVRHPVGSHRESVRNYLIKMVLSRMIRANFSAESIIQPVLPLLQGLASECNCGCVAALGESDRAEIVPGDAARPPRARLKCAVAFVDPPYRSGLAAPALEALDRADWLAPDALAIVELGKREELVPPAAFTFLDERVYGTARLVFLRRKNNENRDVGAEFGRSDAKIIS